MEHVITPEDNTFRAFKFTRHKTGWRAFLCSSLWERPLTRQDFPTKAAARAWAVAWAHNNGIPFKEVSRYLRPPPPTREELHAQEVRRVLQSVLNCDDAAETLDGEGKHEEAAEWWMRAARACERAAKVDVGQARHLRECGESRIEMAIESLRAWGAEMLRKRPSAALCLVPKGGGM